MADDGIVKIGTAVDISSLKSGMDQAAGAVESSTQRMAVAMQRVAASSTSLAEAQKELGAAAARGNSQAASIIAEYQESLSAARSELAGLTETQVVNTAVVEANTTALAANAVATRGVTTSFYAAQGASALFAGRIPIRAMERFLASSQTVGQVLQVAFPIIGAIAMAEILGEMAHKVYDVYENYISLDAAAEKFEDTVEKTRDHDIVNVHSLEDANDRLQELNGNAQRYLEIAQKLHDGAFRQRGFGGLVASFTGFADIENLQQLLQGRKFADQGYHAEEQANEIKLKRLELQHQLNVAKIDEAHAGDIALEGEQRINAEYEKKLALIKEEQSYNAQRDAARLNRTSADSGSQLANIQEAAAQEAATAQISAEWHRKGLEWTQESIRASDEAARQEGAALEKVQRAATEAGNSPLFKSILHEIPQTAGTAREALVRLAETVGKLKTPELNQDSGKQIEASLDQAEDAQIKLNAAQVEGYEIQVKNADSLKEAQLRAAEATHSVSGLSAAQQQAALHAQEYQEALAALTAQLEVYRQAGKDAEAAQVQNQITQLQGSRGVQATGDSAAIQAQVAQPWLNAFNQINSSWLQVQNRMFYTTRNIGLEFAKMGQQIFLSIVDNLEKAAIIAAERELLMLITHQAANQAKVASDAQAAAQSNSISAVSSLKEVTHAAAAGAAKAYQAMAGIPIVGPILGAVAAAATFTAIEAFGAMASFDTGTGYVPHDGIAMIHEGEAIIPAPTVEDLRGSGGGDSVTIQQENHFHGFNPDREFQRQLRRNASHVASALQHHLRQTGKA